MPPLRRQYKGQCKDIVAQYPEARLLLGERQTKTKCKIGLTCVELSRTSVSSVSCTAHTTNELIGVLQQSATKLTTTKLIGVLQHSATQPTTTKSKTAVPVAKLSIGRIFYAFREQRMRKENNLLREEFQAKNKKGAPTYIGRRRNVGISQEVDSYCNHKLICTTYNTGDGS